MEPGTPDQPPEETEPPATEGDGERQHAPGCTLPADHEGDCQTGQAPQPEACTKTESCTLTEGHEGDCVLAETPAPCDRTEGCTLEAGHEGECVVEEQPACDKTEGCTLPQGHEGECVLPEAPVMLLANGEMEHDLNAGEVVIRDDHSGPCVHRLINGGERDYGLVVEGGTHTIILDNAILDPGYWPFGGEGFRSGIEIKDNATVHMTLTGSNEVWTYEAAAGIHVGDGSTLTIGGTGNLDVKCSGIHPGIMLDNADMIVSGSATIAVVGSGGGAGIQVPSGSSLTVADDFTGTLTARAADATASMGSAGIGGYYNQDFGDIYIGGGTVDAHGGGGGAGIGAGYNVGGAAGYGTATGNVTITGGRVNAHGGRVGGSTGAGIGAGENGDYNGTITISGGIVFANGGDKDASAIGGGGLATGNTENGTFQTQMPGEAPGNAVIIAPYGIGDTSGAANWNGFFIGYNFDENAAYYDGDTVVFDTPEYTGGNRTTVQVFGTPNVDFDIRNEGSMTIIAENMGGGAQMSIPRANLVIADDHTLTNDGSITVNGLLRLNDGIETNAKGADGKMTIGRGETFEGLVQVKMDEAVEVIVHDQNLSYTNEDKKPTVEVMVDSLWGMELPKVEGEDYSITYQDNRNASAVAKAIVTPKGADGWTRDWTTEQYGTLHLFGDARTENFTIQKAKFTVGIPGTWTVQSGETDLLNKLPKQDISVSSSIVGGVTEKLKGGKLTWYTDDTYNTPITDPEYLKDKAPGDTSTLYWKYEHQDSNFENPVTGNLVVTISKYAAYDGKITLDDNTDITSKHYDKVYGDGSFHVNYTMYQADGTTKVSIADHNDVSWESLDNNVATVVKDADGTGATITIHDVNTENNLTVIRVNVAEHEVPNNPDESYAAVSEQFRLHVSPKKVDIKSVEADPSSRPYDGTTEVAVTAQLAEGSIVQGDNVTLSAIGTVADPNVGENKPVTVKYQLVGTEADRYEIANTPASPSIDITKANWDQQSFKISGNEYALPIQNHRNRDYETGLNVFKLVVKDASDKTVTSGQPIRFEEKIESISFQDTRYFTAEQVQVSSDRDKVLIQVASVDDEREGPVADIAV